MHAAIRRPLLCLAPLALVASACSSAPIAPGGASTERSAAVSQELGSTRNARIAYPMAGGREELVFLAGALPQEDLAELRALAPNVRVVAGLSRDEALQLAPEAHGIDGRFCTREILQAAERLCWVQAGSAGVERYLALPELTDDERIVLTNMKGMHGPAIADHVFGLLLVLTRDLRFHLDPARRGAWSRGGSGGPTLALQERTLLVVGLGGIGSEVARRGKGFGMHVLATRRSDTPAPWYVDRQGRPQELLELLAQADVVVLCVPLTDETEGLIGARELAAMRPGGYLINIARGRVVDTDALLEALRDGRLAGAGLDVTDPEPLPADHPLWQLSNVVVTPHVAGRAELTEERRRALYLENLRRFGAGEPLLNVVDKRAGY